MRIAAGAKTGSNKSAEKHICVHSCFPVLNKSTILLLFVCLADHLLVWFPFCVIRYDNAELSDNKRIAMIFESILLFAKFPTDVMSQFLWVPNTARTNRQSP